MNGIETLDAEQAIDPGIAERFAADEVLRRSEARFRALIEKNADVILLTGVDGAVFYRSPSVTRVLGWTPEELVGVTWTHNVVADDRPRVVAEMEPMRSGAREVFLQFRARHRDGSIRWMEGTCTNRLDDPDVGAIVGNFRDISERKQAEDALAASRDLLEEAQAIAHVGSWSSGVGADEAIAWSRECYRIFGVPEGTAVTVASFFAHVHPDDRERVKRSSAEAFAGIAPYDIAHRITRPDGSVRWVQERAIVDRDGGGHPIRMVGTVQDVTESHLALEAVRTSEGEFRLLAEAMPQIVWITGPEGDNVYVNQRWEDYTGLSRQESFGDGWIQTFHPDDRERAWQNWQTARAMRGTYTNECRVRRADGAYRWWLVRGVPIHDAAGTITKWFGTCTDIHALKQGEERLRLLDDVAETLRSEADVEQALPLVLRILGQHLGGSHCIYAAVDPDGEHCHIAHEYTDGSASMRGRYRFSDLGARAADAPPLGAPVVVRDTDVEGSTPGAAALGAAGIKAFVSCRVVTQGVLRGLITVGHARPRDWTPDEISIAEQVVARCSAKIEKRAAEAKLRESEAMLRITGQAAHLGGWSLELPDRRITWSDEVCAILEVPAGTQPTFEQAMALYPLEFREVLHEKLEACAREGTPFDLELQVDTSRGRRLWVRTIGQVERSAAGVITRLRGAFQDIDDRRRLQDQFRQAQKMEAVGRLAGGVAHDFNNLLSVVLSYSELVLDDLAQGDALRHDIEQIRTAGQRASALTRQLLAFSRQQVLEPRVLDLDEIVGAMRPMLGRLLGEDIDLQVVSPRTVGRVLSDPGQIEQIVMNLAVNARDAMPDGGKLTIETSNVTADGTHLDTPAGVPPGCFVMIAVTDNGMGMTEATRVRIFEPFFTTKEKGKGTGLGLATVFGIAQQSGGYVNVTSEPGLGSTFKVYLPRTDLPAEASPSIAPNSLRQGSETILLVEDEDQVRTVACAILRGHGYHVLEASNGDEALLASDGFGAPIDLLVTDVVMPRMGGRKLAETLAPRRPTMKTLFASGYTDDAILHHGVLQSDVAFLHKPFTPQTLLAKVRDVLDAGA